MAGSTAVTVARLVAAAALEHQLELHPAHARVAVLVDLPDHVFDLTVRTRTASGRPPSMTTLAYVLACGNLISVCYRDGAGRARASAFLAL